MRKQLQSFSREFKLKTARLMEERRRHRRNWTASLGWGETSWECQGKTAQRFND